MIVAGARPNFIKIAPLFAQLKKNRKFSVFLVHTGQHYDDKLSKVFFKELNIPPPDYNLGVGSGTQAVQTGKIMIAFDEILEKIGPDLVVLVGDVNSTVACALTAAKRGVRTAHVEAGLRSFDWTMPEEINRVVTDKLSDFLFCTEQSGVKNLRREGVNKNKIFLVGNVMIDTLLAQGKTAEKSKILERLGMNGGKYGLITLHRPSNVDDRIQLQNFLSLFKKISARLPVVFPIHPRTQNNLKKWHLNTKGITTTPPLGYLDFRRLMSHATVVLTDSGGIQEETTILGVPCLTLRNNTERPITVTAGTNHIVGTNEKKILSAFQAVLKNPPARRRAPKYWDGKAAERIAKILAKKL